METPLLLLAITITILFVALYLLISSKHRTALAESEKRNSTSEKQIALLLQKEELLNNEFSKLEKKSKEWAGEKVDLSKELIQAETNLNNLEEKLQTQSKELEKTQLKFQKEFQLIADKIVKENSNELSQTHQKELNQLLQPLKEKIKSFEENIEKKYIDEIKERTDLKSELSKLLELNNTLNTQAQNLTTALKGDNKTQGNWGEMILERILESSGLQKGIEYETQVSDTNSENKRIQPDVIIKLPENKHLVVDAKVSLVSYEQFNSTREDEERGKHLKSHLLSIRSHIKNLSDKNYQSGVSLQSPDFVLLFMPIEAAFSLALQHDHQLFQYAWERKVVLVSPTTLLASLRTISSVWKNERQTKNAQDIAEKAGNLYDKFVGFIKDMESIDKSLKDAQNHYNDAFNKLSTGRGNLVKRAEKLKELGAKASKSLPNKLLDDA
ncbi:MAG: DNA recombination protein RmuC [Vicingaceae bacterium]